MSHLKISFQGALKTRQKVKEKDAFDDEVDDPFVGAIESTPEGAPTLHLKMRLTTQIKTYKKEYLRFHMSCTCIALVSALINAQKCTN